MTGSTRFYEVLAPYFTKVRVLDHPYTPVGVAPWCLGKLSEGTPIVVLQKWDAAEALLYVCRRLWGQPYVAPVYALLLHRWLLLNKDAGGQLQRQKHVNVLVSGAPQTELLHLPPAVQVSPEETELVTLTAEPVLAWVKARSPFTGQAKVTEAGRKTHDMLSSCDRCSPAAVG